MISLIMTMGSSHQRKNITRLTLLIALTITNYHVFVSINTFTLWTAIWAPWSFYLLQCLSFCCLLLLFLFFFWVGPHSYQLTIEVSVHDRLPTQPYGIYALNTSMIEVPRNSYSNQIVLAVAVSCSITYNRNHHLGAFWYNDLFQLCRA